VLLMPLLLTLIVPSRDLTKGAAERPPVAEATLGKLDDRERMDTGVE
jgi:hypothetical protein